MHPALLFASVLPLVAAVTDPVRVEQGQLSGVPGTDPSVRVYKGIPFAAPPVGDLRWRAPKPAADWAGVRKADQFSATCMQTPYPEGSLYRSEPSPSARIASTSTSGRPPSRHREKRPVMVWIHGGAFTRGSGSPRSTTARISRKKASCWSPSITGSAFSDSSRIPN